jgi:hypothetical protein
MAYINGRKHELARQKAWVILCNSLLLLGQFHGFTYQLKGQFQGIRLEKPQPKKQTFRGRAAPLERTFGPVSAPNKRRFRLISWTYGPASPFT